MKWVPVAVRMEWFEVVSVVGLGEGGAGGVVVASESFANPESLGKCHGAPVLGCFAMPNGIRK